MNRPAWHSQAACRGLTHLFFPEPGANRYDIERAKATCQACPVIDLCQQQIDELGTKEPGIWAGQTVRERERARGWERAADRRRVVPIIQLLMDTEDELRGAC